MTAPLDLPWCQALPFPPAASAADADPLDLLPLLRRLILRVFGLGFDSATASFLYDSVLPNRAPFSAYFFSSPIPREET